MNKSATTEIYKTLEKCAEKLENDVKASMKEITELFQSSNESKIALNKAKDYHYNEILNHLNEIKVHIETILYHDRQLRSFQTKIDHDIMDKDIRSSKIDRNYIKKQVDAFDGLDPNNNQNTKNNTKKLYRDSNASVEYLITWEKYVDHQKLNHDDEPATSQNVSVNRRRNGNETRKKKKFVSSTMDGFLELTPSSRVLDSVEEDQDFEGNELINEDLTEVVEVLAGSSEDSNNDNQTTESTKPKIVEFIYKNKEEWI